jgi:predicted nucleotidyltransferase
MTRLHRITPEERHRIEQCLASVLASDPCLGFAYLYGSFVERIPFRDVDVAAWVKPETGAGMSLLDYELDLGVRLQRLLRVPVDVRTLNNAPLAFRYHATRGVLLFSHDEEMRSALVETWRHAYWDYQPVARRHLAEVLRG